MSEPFRTATCSQSDQNYLADHFREGRPCSIQNLPGAACAYLAWALWNRDKQPLVLATEGPRSLDLLLQDLVTLTDGLELNILPFPARETLPGSEGLPHPDLMGDRIYALQQLLSSESPAIIVTSIQALLQKTLAPSELTRSQLELAVGATHELEPLAEKLQESGYHFDIEVSAKGQASIRGGLMDLWPPAEPWPVRIEFFGNVIDSIRTFDPIEQRSIEKRPHVQITPPQEARTPTHPAGSDLTAYLASTTQWLWVEPEQLRHHADLYRDNISDEVKKKTPTYRTLRKRIAEQFSGGQLNIGLDGPHLHEGYQLDLYPIEALPTLQTDVLHPDIVEQTRRAFVDGLLAQKKEGWDVHLYFSTPGTKQRFLEQYPATKTFHLHEGKLSEGFRADELRLMVVAESDLYGRRKDTRGRLDTVTRQRKTKPAEGARLAEWTDIQPGDFVVHLEHGIGKYLGLFEIDFADEQQEVMAIEYADKAKLYVPVAQAHLLTRYVGVGKARPRLHAMGGRRWSRDKVIAEKAIHDLASHLLETQALRATKNGYAFPPDTHWQHEFETSFPYQETVDQERAINEVKEDMESALPMDRLVCGDVGYGKTEVALRAAFKSVTHHRQVAMLVPTTVLAQQHFDSFATRMEPFPITIRMLSRFQTNREQQEAIDGLASGAVDIVIGTHRLIQPDINFQNLGLLIIDEEQRFGVEQKEQLKSLRRTVDILTMTATPIPRTLYMSLTGARDMSTIQTPPQERLPIETIVTESNDDVIREAILRELNRDGQVFFLHNRVKTIEKVRQRLIRKVPEARVEIAHGQMPEHELADVMRRFIKGQFDVLLCTTIIESGVDIPNVNTILIDRADRFGLSELYQLRGRVGRYKHKAYAYLLLEKHVHLFDTARKRIGAIKRYSSLGAGFKLALKDLEIRGAGNLLGSEQSGHIAAVGFDLYCQLLKRSVARLKGEEVPPIIDVEVKLDFIDLAPRAGGTTSSAVVPVEYIEDETHRVQIYRKIAAAASEEDVVALGEEFQDRFGPLPSETRRLLKIATARILAALRDITLVEVRQDKAQLTRQRDYIKVDQRFPRLTAKEPDEKLDQLISIIRSVKPLPPPEPPVRPHRR